MEITDEFKETYNEYLFRKADKLKLPIMGTFELTPVCNMDCRMCYIRQDVKSVNCKGGLKSLEFWEDVFDQAISMGMIFCLLTGGEIFTYPHLRELYERLCKKGIHIVLNTNATLLDRETIAWLAEFPPRRLNISLYGASADTYEKLCHYGSGFEKVMDAFQLLQEYNIPFRVHGVLVPSNIADYEGIKSICNRFRVPLEMSFYMFPPLRKECAVLKTEERFTPEEMAHVAFNYRKDQCGGEGKQWKKYLLEKCGFIKYPESWKNYGVSKILCRSGSSVFWVNWKGEIAGCGMEDDNMHDLEKTSFEDAWNAITKYTREICLSEKCAFCKYRAICPVCVASAYCETGDIAGSPEYLCSFCQFFSVLLNNELERILANG